MSNSLPPEEGGARILLDFLGDDMDPRILTALIPMKPHRACRKGQPLTKPGPLRSALAPTGYCCFDTDDLTMSGNANRHAEALLAVLEPRIDAIRALMAADNLTWSAVLFEGEAPGQAFTDLDDDLLRRIARLGLPFAPKVPDRVTFIYDHNISFRDAGRPPG